MRLSGWTLIFPSQKSHSDRLLDEKATVQLPFTSAMDLVPRKLGLKAAGGTFTGKALERAADAICNRRMEYTQNGIFSYAPWVILMSDGKPGDNWESAAQNWKKI